MNQGGKRQGAGRKVGSAGKVTKIKRELASVALSDALEQKLWQKFLSSDDPKICWEAFKLAKMYKTGQPPRSPQDANHGGVTIVLAYKRDPEIPDVQTPDKPRI